jgi:hypothetical protein
MDFGSETEDEMLEAENEFETQQQLEKLAQRVLNHLDWCKNSTDRQDAEKRWEDCQNFWLNKQWNGIKSFGIRGRDSATKRLHPNPVDNYFKAHIEGLVGDITDKPVDIQVKARESSDEEIAQRLSAAIKYVWYLNKGDRKLEFSVRRGVLYGPLCAKVYWDNSWKGGAGNPFVGNVRFFSVPSTNIFLDPRVKATEEKVIQQGAFLIYGVRRSLEYIQRNYPDQGHKVAADTYADYVNLLSGDTEDTSVYSEDTEALVIEYWYKGEPKAPEFPADREVEPQDGWVHKAVISGGVLLEHRTYVYPWYPFVMEWVYPSDESIYGYGDGYDILLPQLIINKLNELSIEGAALQSQGNWISETGNIQNTAQFQKYAQMGGSVLGVADVQRTTRVPGGGVPSSLFAHYRQELQAMEAVSGRYDVAQGRAPRNIQAASAIALLLQQSGGRVRQRARAISSFVEQIAQMMCDLIGMYYTVERLIRVEGKDGKPDWQRMSNQDFMKQNVYTDPNTMQPVVEDYIPEMDIEVIAGTETPTSKAYYSQLATDLFKMNVIDAEALLDTLQFPRWREILMRMRQPQQPVSGTSTAGSGGIPPELASLLGGGAAPAQPSVQGEAMPPDLAGLAGAVGQQPQQPPPTQEELMMLMQILQQQAGGKV